MTILDKCENGCGDSGNIDFASVQETGDNEPNIECSLWKRGFGCGDTLSVTYAALNALFQDIYQRICNLPGVSVITNTLESGHLIATHTSGDGTVENIYETVSPLVLNGENGFTYTNENGVPVTYVAPEVVEEKKAVTNVHNGSSSTAAQYATAHIRNYTQGAEYDPDNVFTLVANGIQVNVDGIYGIKGQVRSATGASNSEHISGNGLFINGSLPSSGQFGGITPDSETTFYIGSSTNIFQIYSGAYIRLDSGDNVGLAARCDTGSMAFQGEFHMVLIAEI